MGSGKILVNGANGVLGGLILSKLPPGIGVPAVRRQKNTLSISVNVSTDGAVDPKALDGIDTIINCAGRVTGKIDDLWLSNVHHPVRLAEAAKSAGVKRFIQASSFSVFGRTEKIDAYSKIRPTNDYGRSKVAAEERLMQLSSANFSVCALRLPFMFGMQNPAMMGSLIQALKRAPIFPVSVPAARRSMLTYSDAAELLIRAGSEGLIGIRAVADSQFFTVELLAEILRSERIKIARIVKIPNLISKLSMTLIPGIAGRLFSDNILTPELNWASQVKLKTGIEAEIHAICKTVLDQKSKK